MLHQNLQGAQDREGMAGDKAIEQARGLKTNALISDNREKVSSPTNEMQRVTRALAYHRL